MKKKMSIDFAREKKSKMFMNWLV